MSSTRRHCLVLSVIATIYLSASQFVASSIAAEPDESPKFAPSELEFFENKVRPLLVERCHKCHGANEQKGHLRLDSRAAIVQGGDTGPAIVPGDANQSLLIDAINYGDVYQMPPKSKLPAAEIAVLTKWVEMRAPWPNDAGSNGSGDQTEFDLAARRASHWCWQPVQPAEIPAVRYRTWPRGPIDQFVLAKLEQKSLLPAPEADRRTLVRRAYFDLIGLPPTPAEVEAFVNDPASDAFDKVIDDLLTSPRFGERWARHWLDLVRYAESRGHEGDDTIPNAYQYRDYVIRALNADVPYNQFVIEHIAGDLMPEPRLHPTERFNESVLATGFWFLGQWVHSPVSIRGDETERFDNMIDVATKTFLGLTVACARCHDHKFDAVSQRDYYALAGYLQSSNYRQIRFGSIEHNRIIASELAELRKRYRPRITAAAAEAQRAVTGRLADYLMAAREAILTKPNDGNHPTDDDLVFADFESGSYEGWQLEGEALGLAPVTGTLTNQQKVSGFAGKFLVNTYIRGDGPQGRAISRPFTIRRPLITFLIGGGAHEGKTCLNLVVDDRVTRTATGVNDEELKPGVWNVAELIGREAHLEIVDAASGGWGHINIDQIVFTSRSPTGETIPGSLSDSFQRHVASVAEAHRLDADVLVHWVIHLTAAADQPSDPFHLWSKLAQVREADEPEHFAQCMKQSLADRQREAANTQIPAGAEVVIDYENASAQDWMTDGFTFGLGPVRAGEPILSGDPKRPLAGVAIFGAARRDPVFSNLKPKPGTENDAGRTAGWNRWGYTLRTPTFTLNSGMLYYLVEGPGKVYAVVDSHRLNRGPLHGRMISEWNDEGSGPRWITHDLRRYQGHRVHLEFVAPESGEMAVLRVVQAAGSGKVESGKVEGGGRRAESRNLDGSLSSLRDLAELYQQKFTAANEKLHEPRAEVT